MQHLTDYAEWIHHRDGFGIFPNGDKKDPTDRQTTTCVSFLWTE